MLTLLRILLIILRMFGISVNNQWWIINLLDEHIGPEFIIY